MGNSQVQLGLRRRIFADRHAQIRSGQQRLLAQLTPLGIIDRRRLTPNRSIQS